MARAKRPASRSTATRSSSALKSRPYKVVFEAVTQEKKKLLTVPSFNPRAPQGFTFVPAGRPELTARCKEYSRVEGCTVFVVSTSHQKARNISQHVCRVGHHFASSVVSRACGELGISISSAGRIYNTNASPALEAVYAKSKRGAGLYSNQEARLSQDPISQEQLDHEARNALTDLFPKIPERDLIAIISRAFKKGVRRVGNAHDLSLQRRVQLATVAHIRHQYTDYDKLVRAIPWEYARAQIEEPCLRLIVQWRGDEGNDENDIEEILREVIVITDDDDEDDEDDEDDDNEDIDKGAQPDRNPSVEIISCQPVGQELRENQISQEYVAEDDHTLIPSTAALGSLKNAQRGIPGRKKRKRPSTKWGNRYRKFRDKYNKCGHQAEDQRQIHIINGIRDQGRDDGREGSPFQVFSSPPFGRSRDHLPLASLDSPRYAVPDERLDDTRLRDQAWDIGEPARAQIYREMIIPMTRDMDASYDRKFIANIPGSEILRETHDHPNAYGQLSQSYRQDVIWPSIEDSLSRPISPTNKNEQEYHCYGLVRQANRFTEKQLDVRPSGVHKEGPPVSDLHRPPSPFSRLRAVPNCIELDYDEQLRKRQRAQYEPVVIFSRYGAAGSGRSPLVGHSYGGDMSKPPRPHFEQPIRQQALKRLGSQSHQLPKDSLPDYHLRDFGEPTGSGKDNSNIYYEFHDKWSLHSKFQGNNNTPHLQPSDYAQTHQQPLSGSLNAPHSRGDYRPTFVGDDKNTTARIGYPSRLRLGNDYVYKPQDTNLERTSFHPYLESHGALPLESRRFAPHRHLEPVGDDHKSHSRSLNFQPESSRPSSHEPPRLQPDVYASSWDVLREGEYAPRLPDGENLLGNIGIERETRRPFEVRYLHNGAAVGKVNALAPRVESRRSSQLGSRAGGSAGKASDTRGAYRERIGKSDRYFRESVKPIYVEQPSGDFQLAERGDRNQYDAPRGLTPNKEIIILD